jgi:glycoside/pentoside/hexuronide:cation symporter, GPH family
MINNNVQSQVNVQVETEKTKFGIKDKLGYMFGEFGNDFNFMIMAAFLMVFYTNVLGISPALAGIIMMVARVWDAFADVTAGRFIDSRKTTKNGKFKPWMIRFAPFLALSLVLTFTKIPGLSSNATFIYAFVTYILWGTLYSAVNIPFGSMASVITNDPVERASLSNFRSIGGALGIAAVTTVVPMVVFVNNRPDSGRFFIVAIILAVLSLVCFTLCYKLTTERIINNPTAGSTTKRSVSTTAKGIVKNKPFLALVASSLIILLSQVVTGTLNTYLFMEYFHNTTALSMNGMITLLNLVIVAPAIAPLIKRFGKKEAASVGLLISSIMYFMLFLLPIENAYIFVVISYIANLGYSFFNFTIWAFVTDVIDYQEHLTGIREDGTVYSLFSFTRKIAQAVAGGLGGFALAAIGYVANAPQQATGVAINLKRIATLTPAITYFIVFLVLMFVYPLTKEKLVKLKGELEAKRV